MVSDVVEDEVVPLAACRVVLLCVVDDMVCSDRTDHVGVPRATHACHFGSECLGNDDEYSKRYGWGPRLILFLEAADYRAINISQKGHVTSFAVAMPDREKPLSVSLNLPGTHNVLNALAAIAVAHELEVDDEKIVSGLKKFQGIGRRFQDYGELAIENGKILDRAKPL